MLRPRLTNGWLAALATTILGCGGGSAAKPTVKVSRCQAITVADFHEDLSEAGHPFLANQRLALIQDGTVPCVDVETAEATTCPFAAGNWLEDDQGRRFAQVGQAVSKDDSPVGDHVIAARVQDDDTVPCVGATGFDTSGYISPGVELVNQCVIEEVLAPYNANSIHGWSPIFNYATITVCTNNDPRTSPHPDQAEVISEDRAAGVFCYAGRGAALNDFNGMERDRTGDYFGGSSSCHFLRSGGLEVPAAKRPATRSLPAPGAVNPHSALVWRPVNPMIDIANGWEGQGSRHQPVAPAITKQPTSVSVVEGETATLTVDATGSQALYYEWQRNGARQATGYAPTFVLPIATLTDDGALFRVRVINYWGETTSETATLTVTKRGDGPAVTITQQPSDANVAVGAPAVFTIAGTCSAGALAVQWQQTVRGDGDVTWSSVPGATGTTHTVRGAADNDGLQVRAQVSCDGLSATFSAPATIHHVAAGSVTLSVLPVVGLRAQAELSAMRGIDEDVGGSFTFISGNRLHRLSADLGTITPVAGRTAAGAADGSGAAASFEKPTGLTHDAAGIIYVADTDNHTIRRVGLDGAVTTLAGLAGTAGATDGTGAAARFARPNAIAIGPDGDLYVSDLDNHRIRRVTRAGVVTTYAGSTAGLADGAAFSARFNAPGGVAVAANGDVLVADTSNNRIRRITRMGDGVGFVETLAGNDLPAGASPDGIGTAAVIVNPRAMALRGNTLAVWDAAGLLRKVDLTTKTVSTLAGSRTLGAGFADGSVSTARLRDLGTGVTGVTGGGFLLVDDRALRRVSAAGGVKTIAVTAATGATPDGVGTLAQVPFGSDLRAVAVDPKGDVLVADGVNGLVRRISPAGVVTLVAGLPGGVGRSVNGVGSEAQFASIGDAIATDSIGRIFLSDNYSLRRIETDGATVRLAGLSGELGAVDGPGAAARFNRVWGLAMGPSNQLLIGDSNNAVRRLDGFGTVTTYAGVLGQPGVTDGPAATARLNFPGQVALAPDGGLYVVERLAGRLRRVAPNGASISTVATAIGLTGSLASNGAGALYFGTSAGLETIPPDGGAATVLLRLGEPVSLGAASPRLPSVDGLAVLGPKQLVVASKGQLYKVTLP